MTDPKAVLDALVDANIDAFWNAYLSGEGWTKLSCVDGEIKIESVDPYITAGPVRVTDSKSAPPDAV